MAPTPQELKTFQQPSDSGNAEDAGPAPVHDGERIVISGMSGLYPQSHNIKEFSDLLYNKVNPITPEGLHFKSNHPEAGKYAGSIPEIDQFDAQFFMMHHKLTQSTDAIARKILEQAYQAIYDAGVSSTQLFGKKVGVFVGVCFSETEKSHFYSTKIIDGFGMPGCSRTMIANRISYWLNAKGPSMAMDQDCCSGTAALEQACQAISRGDCESAIVGSAFLCLHPHTSVHFGRVMRWSKDGKTKSFDQNADGCALSEAVNVLFLQKAKDALRIYADVIHVRNEFIGLPNTETGPIYGHCRDPLKTANFIKAFYDEARLSPNAVEYVEACGAGIPEADKSELEAIDTVFCKDRKDQLFVGSVKSNVGYSQAATGITAITKVLLGYHTGRLAASLHCGRARADVAGVRAGRVRVLAEHQRFRRTFAAVNGLSVTGVNSHVLLHGRYKPKDTSLYKSTIPQLLTASARRDTGMKRIFDDLKSRPIDPEELALLRNIHRTNTAAHLGRGFIILEENEKQETVSLYERTEYFDGTRRPLWFVYSGMGSQWAGMGAQLMRIPVFAAAVERCQRVLEPKGIDLVHIITTTDETVFDNVLNSFLGIAVIQIGLTDILRELGLVPDGIIGHSVGELGCAYADGCLSAEEMIVAAYCRGNVSINTPLIDGAMAAVGLGYDKLKMLCPEDIDIACHNGPESCTISGPVDSMTNFVQILTAKGVFAKAVPSSNIAYHSRYIADAGPHLLKYLKEVIKNPKPRSERWLSTSIPQERWNEPLAQLCSAEYQTNNLLSPVLFEETCRLIPSNAVLVEIAPHGLLQAILKRSLSADCVNIPLTRRKHPDNAFLILEAIGKLYLQGFNPKVDALYPKVEFPVSTGTPHLSHLVEWAHEEKWKIPMHNDENKNVAAVCNYIISLHDQEHAYLRGNVIKGQTLYPVAAALVAAWDMFAMTLNSVKKDLSVEFHDVLLYAQPPMHDSRQLRLSVTVHRGNGYFEILDEDAKVATGVLVATAGVKSSLPDLKGVTNPDDFLLSAEDVYDMLEKRDYSYSGEFRSIADASGSLSEARLVWRGNWVTLLDGMLQLLALRQPHRAVCAPAHIGRLAIDVKKHAIFCSSTSNKSVLLNVEVSEQYGFTRCGGILIENVKFHDLPPSNNFEIEITSLHSTPNDTGSLDTTEGNNYTQDLFLKDQCKTLQCCHKGDLNSLTWVDTPLVAQDGIPVQVHYAGITRRDIRKATGASTFLDSTNCFGMDFSGKTSSGERVMGIVKEGSCSSHKQAVPDLLWPVPEHWSLEDAATVPLAYATAFYCFAIKSQLSPGMNVLIHGGAGALGQALISIALAYQCQVFTTVSDTRKKQFLCKMFPGLKAENIGNSRDHSFVDLICDATNGVGCDIIVSTVKQDLKEPTNKCVGFLGSVIDVAQLIDQDNYSYGMFNLTKKRSYIMADFNSVLCNGNKSDMKKLQLMLSDGIILGYVRPLSRVRFGARAARRAFRLLAAGRHRGRVLLHMREDTIPSLTRLVCGSKRSNLIVISEAESLGLQLAEKLVERCARNLHLHFTKRSNVNMEFISRKWKNLGTRLQITTGSLDTKANITSLINSATNEAQLEGIYVVADEHNNIGETSLEYLDVASRTSCPGLKYFAVINMASTFGQNTCVSRKDSMLPATMVSLPNIEQKEAGLWYRQSLDAVERALLHNGSVYSTKVVCHNSAPLLQQIASLADLNIPENISNNVTLQDLGIDCNKLEHISTYLRIQHNLSYTEEQIHVLTIERIMKLEMKIKELSLQEVKGLASFYNHVDPDELLATCEMVTLPTLLTSSFQRYMDFDPSQTYLCIVPGLEGHHERFEVLCERLKLPALVLQPQLDNPPEDLAEHYAQILQRKLELKDHFYLLGYESGINVALEIAAILENQGFTGTVFCLGCAPDEFTKVLDEELSEFKTAEELENALARHTYTLIGGNNIPGLNILLKDAVTWPEKVEVCINLLAGRMSHTVQYAKAVMNAALLRILQARKCRKYAGILRSRVVIMRAAIGTSVDESTLQKYSQQEVTLHQLTSPLAHVANDLKCAALVNQYLSSAMLEEFNNKNICDTYLSNSEAFKY